MNVPQEVDTLFVSEQRRPLNRASVWHMIKAVAREAGLSDVHPHTLRHSTGYNLVNRGTDLRLIQSFMGHKSINSTIRYTAVDTKRYAKLF
jgi:type 1 fimbriae regulatory protein FimB